MDMLEDDLTETQPAQEEESLRSTLEKAFAANKEEPAAADTVAPVAENTAAERARDEQGRFTAAQQAQQQAAAPAAQQPLEGQQQATQEAPKPIGPPRGWSPASKAAFDALPDFLKADIAKREEDVDKGFQKYSGIGKHVDDFIAAGVDPDQVISAYRAAEDLLAENFTGGIEHLCGQFQIHPVELANEILSRYGQQQQSMAGGAIDPNVQNYIANIEQRLARFERGIEQQQRVAVETDIETFLANPSHKFADNVVDQMADYIKVARAEGRNISLKDAYDAACWQNPEIRQLLIDEQFKAKSQADLKKATKAATQAKAAAASVTGSPIAGIATDGAASRSLRDEIRAAMDSAAGRV